MTMTTTMTKTKRTEKKALAAKKKAKTQNGWWNATEDDLRSCMSLEALDDERLHIDIDDARMSKLGLDGLAIHIGCGEFWLDSGPGFASICFHVAVGGDTERVWMTMRKEDNTIRIFREYSQREIVEVYE